jgi:hypothetical protein
MNLRDKFIQDNFKRCNDPINKLTPSESTAVKLLSRKSELNQKEFNRLAEIATSSERRGMQERTFSAFKCKKCNKDVLLLETFKHKKVLIEASSYHGEKLYTPSKHFCHWNICSSD